MFEAAEKVYKTTAGLTAEQIGEYTGKWLYKDPMPIYRDIYGRRVLHMRERFPCFDSYDYLHEKRYFHWYFIETPAGVTLVHTADERDRIEVVEGFTRSQVGKCGVTEQIWEELLLSGLYKE